MRTLIDNGLDRFIRHQILQFKEAKEIPVHFVGSISYFLKDEITRTNLIIKKLYNTKINFKNLEIVDNIDEAVKNYQKAIKYNKKNIPAYFNLAHVYSEEKNFSMYYWTWLCWFASSKIVRNKISSCWF